MSQVHLEKITPMNWHDVEDLHVGKDQNFLADNVSSLALAGVIREAGFHVYTFAGSTSIPSACTSTRSPSALP